MTVLYNLPYNGSWGNTTWLIVWGQNYADGKPGKTIVSREYYIPIFFNAKILNKILAIQIQQCIRRGINHDQVGFMLDMQD